MIDKIKSEKLIVVISPNYFLTSNVSKAISCLADSLKTKSKIISNFDELDGDSILKNNMADLPKTFLIVNLQNVNEFLNLRFDLDEHFIFHFDILYEGPSINYSLTLCENDSYDLLDLNLSCTNVIFCPSVLKMFPVLYKLIVRLSLLNKHEHLIFIRDLDKKYIYSNIFEKLDISNFKIINDEQNIPKVGKFEYYHIVDFPNVEKFYEIGKTHTIDKVYFKDNIQYWFYINNENYSEYKTFENKINQDSFYLESLKRKSEKIQIDKDGNMIYA